MFRAPKGREREGEYFCFCMEHVREYNATYDYFRGIDDKSLAKFRQAEVIGHRPTWKMGPRGGPAGAQHIDETIYAEARNMRRRGRAARRRPRRTPRVSISWR